MPHDIPPASDPADALERWVAALVAELGLGPELLDLDLVLDLARDAAHGVVRPAAPVTTFLVGYAAGIRGGGRATVRELADRASQLAREHGAPEPPLPPVE